MRLWSVHPKYLDAKGLVALWREGLLAQKVLEGGTRGYINHPQLYRFKDKRDPVSAIGKYLFHVHQESLRRGYSFDVKKIRAMKSRAIIEVTTGQVEFERQHLLSKLKSRDPPRYSTVRAIDELDVHPSFRVVAGEIEDWEITK